MAKKRKIRPDRILVIVLAVILFILLIVLGIKYLFQNKGDDQSAQVKPEAVIEKNGFKIELNDYIVYKLDKDLGFGFVVCDVTFVDSKDIQYDLANLTTSEGLSLGDSFAYEKKLKTSGYDFVNLGTTIDTYVNKNTLNCKLFVPYNNSENKLTLTDKVTGASFEFDLTKDPKDITSLSNNKQKETISSNDYEFICSKPHIQEMMKHNGEPYDSSMLSVYEYRVKCVSIKEGIKVTSAKFVAQDGSISEAYDESYSSSKVENIIGKAIKAGDEYGLFFELYSNQEDHVAYNGTITLEFSDGTSAEVIATLE